MNYGLASLVLVSVLCACGDDSSVVDAGMLDASSVDSTRDEQDATSTDTGNADTSSEDAEGASAEAIRMRLAALTERSYAADCECAVYDGDFVDVESCLVELVDRAEESLYQDCIAAAYADNVEEQAVIDCWFDADEYEVACIEALSCEDIEAYSACMTEGENRRAMCGDAPNFELADIACP